MNNKLMLEIMLSEFKKALEHNKVSVVDKKDGIETQDHIQDVCFQEKRQLTPEMFRREFAAPMTSCFAQALKKEVMFVVPKTDKKDDKDCFVGNLGNIYMRMWTCFDVVKSRELARFDVIYK